MDIAVFAPASMRVACTDMWCYVVALRRLAAPCKLFFLSLGFSALVRTVCLAMSCGCLLCFLLAPSVQDRWSVTFPFIVCPAIRKKRAVFFSVHLLLFQREK